MYRIGVFDSGVGGRSVARAIRRAFPDDSVKFVSDTKNLPYGTKSPDVLFQLVLPILQKLAQDSDVVVIACNTVSTTLITRLRKKISIPLVALEPMVKPAAKLTKSGVIAVCATPTTLASDRYSWLKETYARDMTVVEPDCSDWASMIEADSIEQQKIYKSITAACKKGADVIVLGCTHYHWIEKEINEVAKDFNAVVIQPEQPVVAQLKRVLGRLA